MKCSRREFIRGSIAGAIGALLLTTQGCEEPAAVDDVVVDEEPPDLPHIDVDACIGCRVCAEVAPEAYRMNPDTNKAELIEDAPADAVERGGEACPVDAISW